MTTQLIQADNSEKEQVKMILNNPEFYLKNLAEYQKMLELLSVNKYLTELLQDDDQIKH